MPARIPPVVSVILALTSPFLSAQTAMFSTGGNAVAVTDTATRTLVRTIPVGNTPIDVALSPDGSRAYTANFRGNSVSVIDVAQGVVVQTLAVGSYPSAVGVSRDGQKLYVVRDYDGVVAVYDTATLQLATTIVTPRTNGSMGAVVCSPDGQRVFVASGSVLVLDAATDQVLHSFSAGFCANFALTPDGRDLWCVDSWMGAVYGFDASTYVWHSTIQVGGLPSSIAITQDSAKAFVAVPSYLAMVNGVGAPRAQRTVQVLDLAAAQVSATLTMPQPPSGIALTADGTRVVIGQPAVGQVQELDPLTNALTVAYAAGQSPGTLVMAPALATASSFGTICGLPGSASTLTASSLPWLGEDYVRSVGALGADSLVLAVFGFGSAAHPLTMLAPEGLPGCELLVDPSTSQLHFGHGGSLTTALPLPRLGSLVGVEVFEQVLEFDGFVLSCSNGLRGRLGIR